jgi:hypothetical protein
MNFPTEKKIISTIVVLQVLTMLIILHPRLQKVIKSLLIPKRNFTKGNRSQGIKCSVQNTRKNKSHITALTARAIVYAQNV